MNTKDNEIRSATKLDNFPTKRLLFDRRYGWVIDEWKCPSEEALAGGRGMFCIVPLAKGLLQMASYSINIAADSAIKIMERRDHFSPQQLHASVGNQLQQLVDFAQKPGFSQLKSNGNHAESGNLQELETE